MVDQNNSVPYRAVYKRSIVYGTVYRYRPWEVAVLVPPTGIEVKSDNIRVRGTSNENHSVYDIGPGT